MPISAYPPAENSLARLHGAGLSCGEAGFTGSSGATVWQVDASNGEKRIVGRGATASEA
jgi:hypothetical protein